MLAWRRTAPSMLAIGVDFTDLPEAKGLFGNIFDKIMSILYLNMKNNIFFHFGLYWPSAAFVDLFGLFWPLMSFLSQKIPFWVKIK